jgi:hypothetical protein
MSWKIRGSIAYRRQIFLFSTQLDWLWGPNILLYSQYPRLFLWGKSATA